MSKFKIFETDHFLEEMKTNFRGQGSRIREKLTAYVYPQLKENPHFGKNIKKLKNYHPETWRYRSYANGRVRQESDIDVALVSEAFTGDRYEDRRRIVPLRRKIDNRIEPMPFTPARFSEGGNLIDEIKKTGIRIDAL